MTPKLIEPDQVKPLFDMSLKHPFLLRAMTEYERSAVNHWTHFYRDRISRSGRAPGDYRNEFTMHLRSRGFKPGHLRMERGKRNDLLFQNLFSFAPRITLLPAVFRITGLNIQLHESELRGGFREFVDIYKGANGEYPRRNAFVEAHRNRFFLPQTGILFPHPKRLYERSLKAMNGSSVDGIARIYQQYFDIPDEISHDDLAKISSLSQYRLEDLIDNLRKVQKVLDEQSSNTPVALTPSSIDIDNYARVAENGVPWNAYESWIYHGTELLGGTPKGAVRSLEWLREQAGIVNERTYVRRPKTKPHGYWTKDRIAKHFCEAWHVINPRGFQPARRILADPPLMSDIGFLARTQASIILTHGELVPQICREQNVPCVQVPSVSTIKEQYPGGYQKLLADIERRHEPSGGIKFSSGIALRQMASAHNRRNTPDPYAPAQVVRLAREIR